MRYEVERKFRLEDLGSLVEKVERAGGTFSKAETQEDTYYAHPARNFAETDEALRIRSIGSKNFVTYKGPKIDPETKTRHELELPLDHGSRGREQFGQLLEALGFQKVRTVKKQRQRARLTIRDWEFEVDLDTIDGLGQFVELETMADESQLDAARSHMAELASQLGLSLDERRSYLEMMFEL